MCLKKVFLEVKFGFDNIEGMWLVNFYRFCGIDF